MENRISPVEKLRKIWTPGHEVEEFTLSLEPQTELDLLIRDYLHRIIEQKGPVTLNLGSELNPILNTGMLRFEIVHGPNAELLPQHAQRQVSLWVEKEVN